MTQIHEFQLPDSGPTKLALPRHAVILSVGHRGLTPTLWCSAPVDPELRTKHRYFFCAQTGQCYDELDRAVRFLGTLPSTAVRPEVHIFEVQPPVPSS